MYKFIGNNTFWQSYNAWLHCRFQLSVDLFLLKDFDAQVSENKN